jgi:hypothetical protein
MTGTAARHPYALATSWHPAQQARPLRGETAKHAPQAREAQDQQPL